MAPPDPQRAPGPTTVDERFTTPPEDRGWTLAYLPAWSSRAAAAAAARTGADGLHLTIPPEPGSMFSAWLVGVEDVPERSGEICLVEVFGDTLGSTGDGTPTAAVGSGVHPFRDPALREQLTAPQVPIDVAAPHTYAVEWRPGSLTFTVDGAVTGTLDQAPDYPVQLMLGVFDFPDLPHSPASPAVPELVVHRVRGTA